MVTNVTSLNANALGSSGSTFKIPGGKTGVLLIHGLCGTPAEVRFVAMGLARAGYTVHCPLLAGHGAGRDGITTTWQDWYAGLEEALDELRETCDTVIVAGLCLGALLSLNLAANNPDKVQGVALYSPTLWINGFGIKWYMRACNLIPFKFLAKHARFDDTETLGIKCPRVREFVRAALSMTGGSEMGTAGTPATMVLELRWLAKQTKRILNKVTQPVLIVHSREDDYAALNNAHYLQEKLPGAVDLVVLEDSYHMITLDKERNTVLERTKDFIGRMLGTGARNAALAEVA